MVLFVFIIGMLPLAAIADSTDPVPAPATSGSGGAADTTAADATMADAAGDEAKPMLSAVNEEARPPREAGKKTLSELKEDKVIRDRLNRVLGAKADALTESRRERLEAVKEANVEKLKDLRQDRLEKIADLKQENIDKLVELRQDRMDKISELKEEKIEKLTDLRRERLAKLTDLKQEKLDKLAELREDNLRRLTALTKDKLEQLSQDLTDEEMAKLSHFRQAEINELAKQKREDLKRRLESVKLVTKQKIDLFRERAITAERLAKAKEKYADAQEDFANLQKAYDKRRNDLVEQKQLRERYCRENPDSARCDEATTEVVNTGKNFLEDATLRAIKHFEKLQAKIESSDDISEERAQAMLTELDGIIMRLTDLLNDIRVAESRERLNELAKDLRELWNNVKYKGVVQANKVIQSKLSDLIKRADYTGERIDSAIAELENNGVDVSELNELLEKYYDFIAKARSFYDESNSLRDEANNKIKGVELTPELRQEISDLLNQAQQKSMP